MTIFLCEDSMEGILSGVFAVYESRLPLEECRLEMESEYEPRFFCEYRHVPSDCEKARRVEKKICTAMSEEAYFRLYRASMGKNPNRADHIFRFIILGLKYGKKVLRMLQEPAVYEIFQIDRNVGNEAHLWKEFLRFERLQNGIYYCKIGPENRILELLIEHFSDRFPDMNWMIYDEMHREAILHASSGHVAMQREITDDDLQWIKSQQDADCYTDMWQTFFHAIAIEERRNHRCQRNMLPIRYRKYMTEFQNSGVCRNKL